MKKTIYNNRGLSLVEILGALVILGILLVAFFTFFTQSAKFTAHNSEKLTAVQVAEDIVGIIRTDKALPVSYGCQLGGKTALPRSCTFEYNEYNVTLNENTGPVNNLREVEVIVESQEGAGINNPSFETSLYYEPGAVTP